jgi:Protein of unknown function (DUF2971)
MSVRYRRVYHYLSADWAIEDLTLRRMKLSILNQVNDQRELRAYSIKTYGVEGIDRFVKWAIERFCVLCFAPSGKDELMWQQYGDAHKGICLGLDVKGVKEVEYVSEAKYVDLPEKFVEQMRDHLARTGKIPDSLAKKCTPFITPTLWTKFNQFERERELRAVFSREQEEDGRCYAYFWKSGMYVQEVILGRNCPVSEAEITELVKTYPRRPIQVFRVREFDARAARLDSMEFLRHE